MRPPEELRLPVRLTPRGGSDRIDGVVGGVLRVRVAAAPADGAANASLLRLLADELRVPRSALRIATGETARTKVVALAGVARELVLRRWPGLEI